MFSIENILFIDALPVVDPHYGHLGFILSWKAKFLTGQQVTKMCSPHLFIRH